MSAEIRVPDAATRPSPAPAFYDADDVGTILGLPKPTVYELGRREPQRYGVERFGRRMKFRRDRIDGIARGEG